ncbi:MAG: DUF4097 family beta strand repeat-containing protein, partial [Planctomycetota bacterium]|nr:DUF4097 family beta strand repeat-containing protein [Planctomycetota bacterium]
SRSIFVAHVLGLCCAMSCNISIFPEGMPEGGLPGEAPAPDGIDPNHPNIERFSRNLDFDQVVTLRIEIPTGRVIVQQDATAGTGSLRVTKTVLSTGHSPAQLEAILADSHVTSDRSFIDGGRLEIEADPARGVADMDIAFDVLVVLPRAIPTEIVLGNGPVDVLGLGANVEIQTANGAVTVKQVTGHVVVETSARPIEIVDVAGSVDARTQDSDIAIRVDLPADGFVKAETTNGNIDLAMPVSVGAVIRLDARDGSVSADLGGFTVTNLSVNGQLLTGTLNDGSGQVEARTTGGEIAFVGI